jgi:hypothetical protein
MGTLRCYSVPLPCLKSVPVQQAHTSTKRIAACHLQELRDHVIIAGYGRAGALIGQVLSENLIPFVALDVSNERVAAGKVRFEQPSQRVNQHFKDSTSAEVEDGPDCMGLVSDQYPLGAVV